MDWLTPENIIAILSAALGIAATFGAIWVERRRPKRKRIGYRVQLDTAITNNVRTSGDNALANLFNTQLLADSTIVLLRIENDGSTSVEADDYVERGLHGLTATFQNRTIRGFVTPEPPDGEHLMSHLTEAAGLRSQGNKLYIPGVPMNPGEHFKLLVLLSDGPVESNVTVHGGILGGKVVPNKAIMADDKPPLFSRPAQVLSAVLTVVVITLASIIVLQDKPGPEFCRSGDLTVLGSSAFAPVARDLAAGYMDKCAGATITVSPSSSDDGLARLQAKGSNGDKDVPQYLSFSDGPKPAGAARELQPMAIAVTAFAVIVGDDIDVAGLTSAQIADIYAGAYANWNQLRVPSGKRMVLVSRTFNSGTRATFRSTFLPDSDEMRPNSRDCVREERTPDERRPIHCELSGTDQVLDAVRSRPGAIGYVELGAAKKAKGVRIIRIDGKSPGVPKDDGLALSPGNAKRLYPFRATEFAYTYGQPAAEGLLSSFLDYARYQRRDILTEHGDLPCATPKGRLLTNCQDSRAESDTGDVVIQHAAGR